MEQQHPFQIWTAVRRGNQTAFKELFDLYWDQLFAFAYKVLRDKSMAQDVVQSLFIYLWEQHAELPPVNAVDAYLKRALKHRLLNSIRQENIYQKHVNLFQQVLEESVCSSHDVLQVKESEQQLLNAIESLPDAMKQAFYLHRVEHLSIAEIAHLQGTSPQTIRNQVNIALKKIRLKWTIAETIMVLWMSYMFL
ncbi:hypothetical protein COR50_00105 [Chitinophaga caeni]|uniref:RNA polymerase sigma-70 factor n=1 Tax=Chitinophaga caeni TaxID=2029983 RepID=A0A291QNZ9_9BACT|nr:RNA polymerase sigma-70 factor [Chitinophaga caeni]ATL45689.1 hypothetical protein COR50_00105 [Chitinophaga caeni]